MDIDDLILEYSTSELTNQKAQVTPRTTQNTRAVNRSVNKSKLFSPCSSNTPKYAERKGKGDIICKFGSCTRARNHGQPEINIRVDQNAASTYSYMYQLPYDIMMTLSQRIDYMSELVASALGEDKIDWSSVNSVEGTEPVNVCGQICGTDDGLRPEPNSLMLQSTWSNSAGRTVALDVSQMEHFSFFPGQFVALRGLNPSGKLFVVERALPLPLPQKTPHPTGLKQPLSILCAAGPFTTSDNFDFKPLEDLIDRVVREQPDVLILVGPFIPAKHALVEGNLLSFKFEKIFEMLINNHVLEPLISMDTKILIVSSPKDISHDSVFPCPAYNFRKIENERLVFAPDPCILDLNGFSLNICSTDILFHMSKGEVSNSDSNRMGRLLEHLLTQRCFYPLYPPNEEVNVDYTHFNERTSIDDRPHVCILPSTLRQFVQEVHDVCFINPGFLSKGESGGTFCRIQINPAASSTGIQKNISEIVSVEVAKI